VVPPQTSDELVSEATAYTTHTQGMNISELSGIRTLDLCNHTALDLRLRSQSHRDRINVLLIQLNNGFMYIYVRTLCSVFNLLATDFFSNFSTPCI
jgi:hypothetical protein